MEKKKTGIANTSAVLFTGVTPMAESATCGSVDASWLKDPRLIKQINIKRRFFLH